MCVYVRAWCSALLTQDVSGGGLQGGQGVHSVLQQLRADVLEGAEMLVQLAGQLGERLLACAQDTSSGVLDQRAGGRSDLEKRNLHLL